VKICQLIRKLEEELIEHSKGRLKTSWQIEQLKHIRETKQELPGWVKELIKKYD
jgi:hypothetical protein